MSDTPNEPKMRHCFFCGAEIGRSHYINRFEACTDAQCQREERDAYAQEREDAHERLDSDLGY